MQAAPGAAAAARLLSSRSCSCSPPPRWCSCSHPHLRSHTRAPARSRAGERPPHSRACSGSRSCWRYTLLRKGPCMGRKLAKLRPPKCAKLTKRVPRSWCEAGHHRAAMGQPGACAEELATPMHAAAGRGGQELQHLLAAEQQLDHLRAPARCVRSRSTRRHGPPMARLDSRGESSRGQRKAWGRCRSWGRLKRHGVGRGHEARAAYGYGGRSAPALGPA